MKFINCEFEEIEPGVYACKNCEQQSIKTTALPIRRVCQSKAAKKHAKKIMPQTKGKPCRCNQKKTNLSESLDKKRQKRVK